LRFEANIPIIKARLDSVLDEIINCIPNTKALMKYVLYFLYDRFALRGSENLRNITVAKERIIYYYTNIGQKKW
jgi:hypothetical protein